MDKIGKYFGRLAAAGILVALLGIMYWGLAVPVWQAFQNYDDSIAMNLELIRRFRAETIDTGSLEQQRAEAAKNDAAQAGLLRGSNDAVAAAFIQQFVTTAVVTKKGTMRSVQILPAKDQGGFRRITIRAQMNFTTSGLRGALYRIETTQPFLFIDNLDIRQAQQPRRRDENYTEVPLLVRFDVYGFIRAPAPKSQGS